MVIFHRPRAATRRELEEGDGAQRWPETEVEQFLESLPRRRALGFLDVDVPDGGAVLEIVGGHPSTLRRHDPLLNEERFALVDEGERIGLAVVARKFRPPVFGRAVLVVLTVGVLAGRSRRLVAGQDCDRLRVSLDGLRSGLGGRLEGGQGFGEGVQGSLEVGVSHGCCMR